MDCRFCAHPEHVYALCDGDNETCMCMVYPRKRMGFFVHWMNGTYWYPNTFFGHDECGRETIGFSSKLFSIYFAYPCRDDKCICRTENLV